MNTPRTRLALLSVVAAAALSACGGGEPAADARATASQADARRSALADLTTAELTTLFDWAEYKFPSLFPKPSSRWAQPFAFGGESFWVSAYAGAGGYGNFLGITPDGRVFGHGDFVGVYNAAVFIGRASDYSALVSADRCSVYPTASGCVTNPPVGALNECTDAAAASLPDGFRTRLVYEFKGPTTFEQVVESLVTGNKLFEGKTAREVTSTATGRNTVSGFSVDITAITKTYHEAAQGGLWSILGSVDEVTTGAVSVGGVVVLPSSTSTTRSVYTPAYLDGVFTLRLGESRTVQYTAASTTTTTSLNPLTGQVETKTTSNTGSESETYTFLAKESVTVPAGTYQACKYRSTDGQDTTDTWFIIGKGVPAKIQSGDQIIELKPGSTYNGAPL